jgi:hypothetical protein
MNAIKNVVQASKNTVGAAANSVSVVAQMTADGTALINTGVGSAPGIIKSLLTLPFAATKGYLVQEGVDEAQAEAQAYRYVRQPLARTITQIGEGSGKLLSDLLKEDNLDAAVARIETITIEAPQ